MHTFAVALVRCFVPGRVLFGSSRTDTPPQSPPSELKRIVTDQLLLPKAGTLLPRQSITRRGLAAVWMKHPQPGLVRPDTAWAGSAVWNSVSTFDTGMAPRLST